ncbi:MAG: response regulator [Chloroflexi bacterium]|nr:response regulator [Chloroflexota bacterium]
MSESPSQTKLLYVDDDALSREVMHVLASKVIGADITLLDDNTNFMDKVRDLPAVPDVIFLDIQMRPHDGYEMLKMLRGDSMYREATVIAMTASVMATDVQALRAAGFNGLIGKPILRQVFPSLLKQILTGEPVWFVS